MTEIKIPKELGADMAASPTRPSGSVEPADSQEFLQRTVLHAGCGPCRQKDMPSGFQTAAWRELRYDINPAEAPDFVGSITDMSSISTGAVDALYNSHVIEHLYAHEVPIALSEFHRVLKPGGFLVLNCPDLQSVAELVATGKLLEPAYQSGMGPISAVDILYGHRPSLADGNLFMAHRYGFTEASLAQHLIAAGFARTATARSATYDVWAIATKHAATDEDLSSLARTFMPPFTLWAGPPPSNS